MPIWDVTRQFREYWLYILRQTGYFKPLPWEEYKKKGILLAGSILLLMFVLQKES